MSLSTRGMFADSDMKAVSEWTGGKLFGKYRGHRTLDNGITILSHTGGFAVFLPPEVFHKFDIQVPISYAPDNGKECWIAGKGFGFVKVDIRPEQVVDEESKKYFAKDIKTSLDKIEEFVMKNFVNASQLYPDSSYFTHGSYVNNPDMARPFRLRMGGNYHISF